LLAPVIRMIATRILLLAHWLLRETIEPLPHVYQ
jgi:hypothetical protein